MPLYVTSPSASSGWAGPVTAAVALASVGEQSCKPLDSVPRVVNESDDVLYVGQGEIAVGVPGSSFTVVGTDDATTCMMLLAHGAATNSLLVTHLDGPERCAGLAGFLDSMVPVEEEEEEGSAALDVYVVGGMLLEQGEHEHSEALLASILMQLELTVQSQCRLHLLSVLSHNTSRAADGSLRPKVCGAGFVCASRPDSASSSPSWTSSGPFVAHLSFPPASRGPCTAQRNAALSFGMDSGLRLLYPAPSLHTQTQQQLTPPLPLRVHVAPVQLIPQARALARHLSRLPSPQLLQATSSSPLCEPPHYAAELRAALAWVLGLGKGGDGDGDGDGGIREEGEGEEDGSGGKFFEFLGGWRWEEM